MSKSHVTTILAGCAAALSAIVIAVLTPTVAVSVPFADSGVVETPPPPTPTPNGNGWIG